MADFFNGGRYCHLFQPVPLGEIPIPDILDTLFNHKMMERDICLLNYAITQLSRNVHNAVTGYPVFSCHSVAPVSRAVSGEPQNTLVRFYRHQIAQSLDEPVPAVIVEGAVVGVIVLEVDDLGLFGN